MKTHKIIFIGIIVMGAAHACTPEQITEQTQAEQLFNDKIGTLPDTGDDQSQEPDNEKDG